MDRPMYELSDIVRRYGEAFSEKHHPSGYRLAVLKAIKQCRTEAMGGHVDGCESCGHVRISYNSCRNRHSTKCQGVNRERCLPDWSFRRGWLHRRPGCWTAPIFM